MFYGHENALVGAVLTLAMTLAAGEPPAGIARPEAVRQWIGQLGSNDFKKREHATRQLSKLYEVPDLLRAATTSNDAEVSRRAEIAIAAILARELRPLSFTRGSGYQWQGVFAAEMDGKQKVLYLCDKKDKDRRIRVSAEWTDHIFLKWNQYQARDIEGYTHQSGAPLEFYLLSDPK